MFNRIKILSILRNTTNHTVSTESPGTVKLAMVKEAISRQLLNKAFKNRVERTGLWNTMAQVKGIKPDKIPYYVHANSRKPISVDDIAKAVIVTGKPC